MFQSKIVANNVYSLPTPETPAGLLIKQDNPVTICLYIYGSHTFIVPAGGKLVDRGMVFD